MSEFSCPIVKIRNIQKHPNADTLSIVEVQGSFCVFRTDTFREGDLAVFVPIDAMVPVDNIRFAFLAKGKPVSPGQKRRIKATRLRGFFSDGLLVTIPQGLEEGQNAATVLGVTKYEEPEPVLLHTEDAPDPTLGRCPVYDLESFKKYHKLFEPGEQVIVTEKLHGCSARYLIHDGQLHASSHRRFKKDAENCLWWKVAHQEGLAEKLNFIGENYVVYGEVYGNRVQDLKYGMSGQAFAAFDIYDLRERRFVPAASFDALCKGAGIPTVPVLYRGPYNKYVIDGLVNPDPLAGSKMSVAGEPAWPSTLDPKTIREGAVIRPVMERLVPEIGRLVLKYVSNAYHLRGDGTEYH